MYGGVRLDPILVIVIKTTYLKLLKIYLASVLSF